MTLILIRKQYF